MKLASGSFVNNVVIICGGYDNNTKELSNTCFTCNKNGSWSILANMINGRSSASSINRGNSLWITGGNDSNKTEYISLTNETEYISFNGTVSLGPPLPIRISKHTILSINETFSMLIGGYVEIVGVTKKTWYYNHENTDQWIPGPELGTARFSCTSGIIKDKITQEQLGVVVGGSDNPINGPSLNSVEILLPSENIWIGGKTYLLN